MRLTAWLCAVLVMLQSGCAPTPSRLLPGQDREQLGTIGVTAARYAPRVRIKGPGQTGGAAGIAVGGVGAAAATLAACFPNPIALITCPSLLLAMTALGATAGGMIGHQINAHVTGSRIEAAGPEHLDDSRTQRELRERVIRNARASTSLDFIEIDEPAPADPASRPDYRSLAAKGIGTVLEVALVEIATEGRPLQGIALALTSRIRLVRAGSGVVLGEETFHYRSEGHSYEEWSKPDSEVFRTALERGYQSIAEQVAGELSASGRYAAQR